MAGVIIPHFHDDHIQGLKTLSGVPMYGSGRYQETLNVWTEKEEHKYFTPADLAEDTVSFKFKEHIISIISFPGHSVCTVLININDACLYIADELIFSPEQEPVLPAAETN